MSDDVVEVTDIIITGKESDVVKVSGVVGLSDTVVKSGDVLVELSKTWMR